MSIQVSYRKQFILGLMLLIIFLVVIEGIARIYDYFYPNCVFMTSPVYKSMGEETKREICFDNIHVMMNDYPLYLLPNQHLKTVNIDNDGFRGNEMIKDKPPNTYRIFVVGGSTTFGSGSTSDRTTIAGYLQSLFDSAGPKASVEVINAGIPGAYSFTETALIQEKLLAYKPDLIIVYDGWNDLERDYERYYLHETDTPANKIVRELRDKSDYVTIKVIIKAWEKFRHDTVKVVPFNSDHIDEKVSLWENHWMNICKLGKKNNFNVIITLQPIVGTGTKKLTSDELRNYEYYDHSHQLLYYQKYANALSELNNFCTKTADLRNSFDDITGSVFYDEGHVGDDGNQIIANKLFELTLPIVQNEIS